MGKLHKSTVSVPVDPREDVSFTYKEVGVMWPHLQDAFSSIPTQIYLSGTQCVLETLSPAEAVALLR